MLRAELIESADSLFATAWRLTGRGDLAEDLVQEAAAKALRSVPELRDAAKARAWLFKILVNCARDHFRKSREWSEYDADDGPLDRPVDSTAIERATTRDVRRALAEIGVSRRAAVVLIDVEGFTIAEAADILGIPPGTAASRLARARVELRERLQAYQPRPAETGGTR